MIIDFPDALIALVNGRDAERYLNSRLSNNIKALADGEWIDAAALSPQGKIEGIYQVKRLAKEEFLLSCDGGDRSELTTALKRYIVADRVTLTDLSEQYQLVHFAPNLSVSAEIFAQRQRQRTPSVGSDLILLRSSSTTARSAIDHDVTPHAEYELLRLAVGLYAFPNELRSISIGEIDYHALVSFKKGCYVGQELIEKVDSFATSPKLLARISISGQHTVASGTEVYVGEDRVGKVVASASAQNYRFSIVVARIRNEQQLAGKTARFGELSGTIILQQAEQIHV